MPLIETKTGTVYYSGTPDLTHTPLILIHGAGGSRLDWPGELRHMDNGIALDLPGHGKSGGTGRQTIDDYAADVIALMDALDIEKAVIIGHSMGGGIGQRLALDYTERVQGLVLIGTGAKLRVHPDILAKVLDDQAGVANLLKDWIWGKAMPQPMRDLAYEKLMEVPAQVMYGDYVACDAFDVRDRLHTITTPTLVIGGTQDAMAPHKFSVYLHENIPNAQLITVDSGHMIPLEAPEAVTSAIQTWLKSLEGA